MGLEQERGALDLAAIFDALSHPRRLVIVECLLEGEKSVGELVNCERLSPSTQVNVSQQLSILRGAGLIKQRREGNRVMYRVVPSRLSRLLKAGDDLVRERTRWQSP
jgi:DNA-binding transcriptional ArsR family regulator